ncbi:histone-lysine N-methyltransferase SMYD3-like isoform X2 [Ptychodera flava]|uniref:histone-lysine N-methyltransferase SMYD3-like isoform X2 n=1 Tax=Ptychodera flava TaxID=63121 RepID=UPI00396AA70F
MRPLLSQRLAWLDHKAECGSLKAVAPRVPTDSVRLVARLLNKLRDSYRDEETKQGIKEFKFLQSHTDELSEERRRQFSQMMFVLQQCVEEEVLNDLSSDLLAIFGRMVSNSFSVCDAEMKPIGVAIYPKVSLLNHSCDANCVAVFNGTEILIRSVRKLQQGEECFMSYIEVMSSTQERKQQLKEQYYFECDCQVCQNIEQDKKKQALKCSSMACSEMVLPDDSGGFIVCAGCSSRHDKSHSKTVTELVEKIKDSLTVIETLKKQQNIKKILELCEEHLKSCERVLHECNIYAVQLLDAAMDACIDLQQWKSALKYGIKTILPYRLHYPACHPNVGVQLMRIGKLQLFLSHLQDAEKSLQQAREIIHTTHGSSHPLSKELERLYCECREELQVEMIDQLDLQDYDL